METIRFDELRLASGDRILDVGCGQGRHTLSAALLADCEAIGVDLSVDDLGTAAERAAEFEIGPSDLLLASADGTALPFADASFDKVICSEVLEHVPNYMGVLAEITRVLRPGGILAVSVPRFFPEWVCWRLSDGYHNEPGGHIRIFNAGHLDEDVSSLGYVRYAKHHAHALHVPYWWLRCLAWGQDEEPGYVRAYHRMLVWDLIKKPLLTTWLEKLLNPIMGKSVVMYYART